MNKALSWKTDEHFNKGKEYDCTNAFGRFEDACVEIVDDNGDMINVSINDPDFTFYFNVRGV